MSVVSQAMEFFLTLGTKVPWGEIPNLEDLIKDIDRVAEEFIRFLKNGGRVGVVSRPLTLGQKAFAPYKFLGTGWLVWRGPQDGDGREGDENRDVREDNLTEIDLSELVFQTSAESVMGEEKLARMIAQGEILLGGRTFFALWEDYRVNAQHSVLEQLYQNFQIAHIDFPGLVLRSWEGYRCLLNFSRDSNGKWNWGTARVDSCYGTSSHSASLASKIRAL